MKKSARLTLDILTAVADGLLLFELNGRYRHVFMLDGMAGVRRLLSAEEAKVVRRRYYELRRQKLIKERRSGKKLVAKLTGLGNVRHFRLRVRESRRRQDGKRLLITYDIPERLRAVRDALRYLLKQAGFRRHQQSVWITDLDVKDHLDAWIRLNRLKDWVNFHEI